MDAIETVDIEGWELWCSGERLPSGLFQAAVRRRVPPDGQVRTLLFGREPHATARAALEDAKVLALQWARVQRH